ncbi:MAG: erythromycin esterase family protein [Myxococcota bacterium]
MLGLWTWLACRTSEPSGTTDAGPDDTDASADTSVEAPPDTASADPRVVAEGVWVLDGTGFDLPRDDLAPLVDIVGDARLVGIGEPVHYSNGFAEVRARLIPWLVEDLGFRAVALEAGWNWAEAGRPYVEDGTGELADAMASVDYDLWQSEAHAELLQWLHDWNVAHPDDRVTWFGFDMQSFYDDFPWLRAVVAAADPAAEVALWPGVAGCVGGGYVTWEDVRDDPFAQALFAGDVVISPEQRAECQVGLDAIGAWADSHADELAAAAGPDGPGLVRVALTALAGAQDQWQYGYVDVTSGYEARDAAMAEVLEQMWTLRGSDRRLVVWAHNLHLYRSADQLVGGNMPFRDLGSWLTERYGVDYAPIGQLCGRTSYDWAGTGAVTELAPVDSVEGDLRILTGGEHDALIVDVAAAIAAGGIRGPDGSFGTPDTVTGDVGAQLAGVIWLRESEVIDLWDWPTSR